MSTFTATAPGITSVPQLLAERPASILLKVRRNWFENDRRLNLEIGQYHRINSTSWIFQFVAPSRNSFDEIVPSFVTAVINSGNNHLNFFFGSLDIVCSGLSGMYESRIIDDCQKIGFWVDWAQPSFDCRFTNQEKTEMEIQTNLFLKPKPGKPNEPIKRPLTKLKIAEVSGGTGMWLPA
jgi:hypothetical protein